MKCRISSSIRSSRRASFADEFLRLPEEVLTTTMIHHQHFFPITSDQGKLLPVFLAVLNMEPEHPEVISRNMERVLTARLRDAQFFYQSDRQQPLAEHQQRLNTVLFHKKIGTYLEKSEKRRRAGGAHRGDSVQGAAGRSIRARSRAALQGGSGDRHGARAHRAAGHDGRHLRARGWPARGGVEGDLLPLPAGWRRSRRRRRRGSNSARPRSRGRRYRWPTSSHTVTSMFAAGERPTGSRDPYGLRRAAQGIVRILVDLPELTGLDLRLTLADLVERARHGRGVLVVHGRPRAVRAGATRLRPAQRARGHASAIRRPSARWSRSASSRRCPSSRSPRTSSSSPGCSSAFGTSRRISTRRRRTSAAQLTEPAEIALAAEVDRLAPVVEAAVASGTGYRQAFAEAAKAGPAVAKFFDDVMVMADDPKLRDARLRLLRRLEGLILQLADVSEIVPEEK